MNYGDTAAIGQPTPKTASWGAVFALTLCVGTLIASEFMPVSLLTPIAADLGVSEGTAGQAIAVSGLFAVLTSLSISSVTRGIDRRLVLLSLTVLMIISGATVAFAPNTAVFMAGRALVGVVIGGFWSMSAATVMRLVPGSQVPRALGLLNGGNALAATIAAPLGSFLGQYIGWRGAFFAVVPLAAVTLVWMIASLPSMPPNTDRSGTVFRVLRRKNVPLGMAAVSLFFMGQFVLQTYLRPFLETVTAVDTTALSLILLVIGAAGVVGTYLIGLLLKTRLYSLLILLPLLMAGIGVALTLLGHSPLATTALLAVWGLIGTAAPVGWWTIRRAGGGLMGGRQSPSGARWCAGPCAPGSDAFPRKILSFRNARDHSQSSKDVYAALASTDRGSAFVRPGPASRIAAWIASRSRPSAKGLARNRTPPGRSPAPGAWRPDTTRIPIPARRSDSHRASPSPSREPAISMSVTTARGIRPDDNCRRASSAFSAMVTSKPASSTAAASTTRTSGSSSTTRIVPWPEACPICSPDSWGLMPMLCSSRAQA